jgi:hypothetical protein
MRVTKCVLMRQLKAFSGDVDTGSPQKVRRIHGSCGLGSRVR